MAASRPDPSHSADLHLISKAGVRSDRAGRGREGCGKPVRYICAECGSVSNGRGVREKYENRRKQISKICVLTSPQCRLPDILPR